MTTIEYITKPGDRWDLIAFKAYGTVADVTLEDGRRENAIGLIIRSNPELPIESILLDGLLLQLPVIPSGTVQTEKESLPPWKR
ncbi:tail protein X [Parasegetibacter sp. NRK P23]|uniref:tail protein X n=1 Tax=Parasegetibacter sp. NRK P23 TaxID=2942999 RepID=UPI0020444C60|nr:hypothetical protein [Parasegetibacter sp. NRK P23]MCM5528970.1 hypothetical protein [Parasegetibacter sp. NRK P23]